MEEKHNLIEKVHDAHAWNEILHHLHEVLRDYEKELPDDIRQHLDEIVRYTDASPEKMANYYQDLKNSLEQALHTIPPPVVPSWVVAIVIVGGVGDSAGILYYLGFFTTIYVDVVNNGCNTIQIPSVPTASIPGLKLPENISRGESRSAELPGWLNVKIYTTSKDTVTFDSWGRSMQVHVPEKVSSIQLNGEILGSSPMSLARQNQLVISCR